MVEIANETIAAIAADKPTVRGVQIFTTMPELVGIRGAKLGTPRCSTTTGGEVFFVFEVACDSVSSDTVDCVITLDHIDERDFDTRMKIHNGDWATLREQLAMLTCCIEFVEQTKLIEAFGRVA